MIKLAIIVFREAMEIAFLLGVILAATKPIKDSHKIVILGALAGISFASIFAFFTKYISASMGELGDEIFNSVVILLTALLISWTVVWMQGYTKKMRKNLGDLSEKINAGKSNQLMIVFVVAGAIFREAVEIILFVYSVASADQLEAQEYLNGIGFGLFGGLTVGTLLCLGVMKYAGKYIFSISTILLTLIAASLASEAAAILTSTGIIDILSEQLWDSSWLVSDASIFGKILNITIGYDARPNAMQFIFYLSTISLTLLMVQFRSKFLKNNNV